MTKEIASDLASASSTGSGGRPTRPELNRRPGGDRTAWVLFALALIIGLWAMVRWREAKAAAEREAAPPPLPVNQEQVVPANPEP
jgi:hypothetical protein